MGRLVVKIVTKMTCITMRFDHKQEKYSHHSSTILGLIEKREMKRKEKENEHPCL